MSNSKPQIPATVRKTPAPAPVPDAPNQSFHMKSKSMPDNEMKDLRGGK